jgi:ferredoxin
MKVTVDLDLCQGHSVCAEECPEVFAVEEQPGGYGKVRLLQEQPPEALRAKVQAAAKYCPNRVIRVEG